MWLGFQSQNAYLQMTCSPVRLPTVPSADCWWWYVSMYGTNGPIAARLFFVPAFITWRVPGKHFAAAVSAGYYCDCCYCVLQLQHNDNQDNKIIISTTIINQRTSLISIFCFFTLVLWIESVIFSIIFSCCCCYCSLQLWMLDCQGCV